MRVLIKSSERFQNSESSDNLSYNNLSCVETLNNLGGGCADQNIEYLPLNFKILQRNGLYGIPSSTLTMGPPSDEWHMASQNLKPELTVK